MRRLLSPALILSALAAPLIVGAQEFGGSIIPNLADGDQNLQTCAAGWKAVVIVVSGLVSFAIYIGIIIAILIAIYAGILFIFNSTNAEGIQRGKTLLTNAAVGLLLTLGAWLIVNTILVQLGVGGVAGATSALSQNGSLCIEEKELVANPIPSGGTATSTNPGRGTASGTCKVVTDASNPCSVQALSSTCFASRAQEASRICNVESAGGNPNIPSGSDRLNGGSGPSYSIGLWQINLTTTDTLKAGWGMDCRKAFSGACQGRNLVGRSKPGACYVKVTDEVLYHACVAAAKIPKNNSQAACQLYGKGTFQPWSFTANKCSVPKTL